MRVLYLIHSTAMSGSTISFANMVEGLMNEYNVEPYIIYPSDAKELEIIKSFEKKKIQCFPATVVMSVYPPAPGTLNPLVIGKFLKKIWLLNRNKVNSVQEISQIVKKVTPDIIHSNTGTVHEAFIASKSHDLPHFWHLREYQDKDFGWKIYPSRATFIKQLKKSYVLTISQDIMNNFKLNDYRKAHVIYNGVMHASEAVEVASKQHYFLCASRVSEEKGHKEVIRAFASFYKTHSHYRLIIAGFGGRKYVSELKQLAATLGCQGAIDLIGYQDKDKIYELMRAATALIVASRYEGFGRMTAEAVFCGCMVIGHDTGGTREILEHVGGYLYKGESELEKYLEEVAEKINTVNYRKKLILAQELAVAAYSIEQNVNALYRLYCEATKANWPS